MNKSGLTKSLKGVKKFVSKHSPEILVGIGIAGMITTTVLAVRATPKALECIEKKKREERKDKLTPVETVKATWKCYIPAAITGVTSTGCLIGASKVHLKRNAALATAYKLSETALTEYQEKVIETIGEKKERAIHDELDKDRMEKNPVTNSEVIVTHCGNTLCLDSTSGRYFESDIDHIKKAENALNKQMLHDLCGYVSLNDFYDELGLDHTAVGEMVGWNTSNMIDIRLGSQIAKDGRPCIVVGHNNAPKYDYDS